MDKLKQVFEFFNVNEKEIKEFLVKDLGIFNKIDKLEYEDYKKIADYFKINVSWFYDNSEELLIEKYGFYKRYESFCKEILEKNPTRIYIISEYKPDKSIDESNDSNYFYLIAEYEKRIFNGKEIKTFEIFDTSGCRWGYWRCRWEFKKLLLCLKKNYFSFTKLIGKINENIKEEIYKFKKGEIKFDDLIKNFSIAWYPRDYIEFKYENVNAKEEDELKDILMEFTPYKYKEINNVIEYYNREETKLKKYLIDLYKCKSEKIKSEYSIGKANIRADLVLLDDNEKIDIIFEIKIGKNKKLLQKKAKEQLLKFVSFLDYKPKYIVIVFPYENDFDFYIYSKDDDYTEEKLNLDIGIKRNIDLVNNILNFLYSDGKISKVTAIKKFYTILNNFLNKKFPNNIDEKIVYRYLYLINNVKTKKLIQKIIEFDESLCKNEFFCFKKEFIEFLNKTLSKQNITFENFQPSFINLDFNKISIYKPNNLIEKFMLLLDNVKQNYFYKNSIIVYSKDKDLYFGNGLEHTFIIVKESEYSSLLERINKDKIITRYKFEVSLTDYNDDSFLMIEYNPRSKDNETSDVVIDTFWKSHKKQLTFKASINKCDCKNCIKVKGIKNKVLNFDVIQGFISIKDLQKIKIETLKIQRDIYDKHIEELENYILNGSYQFLPNIIFGIEGSDDIEKDIIGSDNVEICLSENLQKKLKIIDGNHRFNALKKINIKDNLLIGFTIILFKKEQFAPIFYALNSKMKPLDAEDYVRFVNYLDKKIEILDSLKKAGLLGLKHFKNIKNIIGENELVKEMNEKVDVFILKLSEYFEKNQINLEDYYEYFQQLLKYAFGKNLDIEILRNIFQSVFKNIKYLDKKNDFINKYLQKEFDGFLEYIQINSFENMIKDSKDIDLLYKTYKKTYIPKSRKIYLSMPYHIHEDVIYYVIKDIINEISQKIGEKIELIRTDKRKLGVHKQIENKVYEEIEESDLMIADITGNNANVFAEVGYKMAVDTSKGLKEPQIIFVKNTKGYYERVIYEERRGNRVDEFQVNEHIRKNKVTKVAFNFAHIDQIEFEDVEYLKRELENMLLKYYNYYQIKKV